MKRPSFTVTFILALALALAPAPAARADTPPPDDDTPLSFALTGEARALYDIGRTSFAKGDVAAALPRFTRAHELSGDPRLMWNMAACEASLKHYARAMTLVDRYLATSGTLISDRDREQAARFRAAARPLVAVVDLTITPAQVSITVDGETAFAPAPDAPLYLDAGRRRIHVAKPGYRGIIRVETVTGGASLAWKIDLERLRVRSLFSARPDAGP